MSTEIFMCAPIALAVSIAAAKSARAGARKVIPTSPSISRSNFPPPFSAKDERLSSGATFSICPPNCFFRFSKIASVVGFLFWLSATARKSRISPLLRRISRAATSASAPLCPPPATASTRADSGRRNSRRNSRAIPAPAAETAAASETFPSEKNPRSKSADSRRVKIGVMYFILLQPQPPVRNPLSV